VRERLFSQRTGIINQIRAFLLERGIAVRQGQRFLRAELPRILATPPDVLSPRMVRVIEGLAGDWRRLDERIEDLSGEIEAIARQEPGCERLMSVPGIGPIISSAMVAAIGTGDDRLDENTDPELACFRFGVRSPKAVTSPPGWGWSQNRCRPEIARSWARYPSAAIGTYAFCSYRRLGLC